jgi:hypothetical protein
LGEMPRGDTTPVREMLSAQSAGGRASDGGCEARRFVFRTVRPHRRLLQPNVDEHPQLAAARKVLRLDAYAPRNGPLQVEREHADYDLTRHGIPDEVIAAARQEQLASPQEDAERYAS